VSKSTLSSRGGKACGQSAWKRPYRDLPLSYHARSGRLSKVVRGKRHDFGYADRNGGWQAAVEEWSRVKVDLLMGQTPKPRG
jgi:hypothetical protein